MATRKTLTYFALTFCFLVCTLLYGQINKIDSLLSILKTTKTDSITVKALNGLAMEYRNNDPDTALYYAEKAKTISIKINYKNGLAESHLWIGTVNANLANYQEAIVNLNKSISIGDNKEVIGKAYGNLGLSYYQMGKYQEALKNHFIALKIRKELKNQYGIANTLNNIGLVYKELGNLNEAIKYHFESLDAYEKINNIEGLCMSFQNIGNLYFSQENYKDALVYYEKSLQLSINSKNKRGEMISYYNIGGVYLILDNYSEALKYYNLANTLNESLNDNSMKGRILLSLGKCYNGENKNNIAIEYFLKALEIYSSEGNKNELILIYGSMASAYIDLQSYQKAEEYAKMELTLSTEIGALEVNANQQLSKIYELTGRDNLALKHYKSYTEAREKLINEKNIEKTVQAQMQFEYEKKTTFTKLEQEKKDAITNAEAKKQKTTTTIIILALLIVSVLAILIFRGLKIQRKANEIISKQKEVVTHQKQIVEEHQKEILDSIHYAKRIQNTLLAHKEFVDQYIPHNFIYFNPKDIVSGDFYWATKKDNYFYFAVCDSTGHGVPGAFMSLLNIGFLSEAINEKDIVEPASVFNYVRERLVSSISKNGQKDGFDGILLRINLTTKQMVYAAANNNPVVVSKGEIKHLNADKMPVGYGERKEDFTQHTIELLKEDVLYLYTDGYADQFGGPKGKKFKYKQLDELLLSIVNKPLSEQSNLLSEKFNDWKGNLEQVDDVCLIGIKIE
jgi:serine phosphatase RsbU (regulator of sigma subunit)